MGKNYRLEILVLLVSAFSLCIDGMLDETERGNQFIDDLLQDMLNEKGHEFDPYLLEDSAISFSKKVWFVNVTGVAKLYNGRVTGLKSLHRPEDCTIREEQGRTHVTALLGAGVLDLNYDGTVKFMEYGPTVHIHGTLAYAEIIMEFSVDDKTGKNGELHEFAIEELKGMSFKITGLGPMNWAMNYMISSLNSMFSGFIKRMIGKTVRNHIAERLPKYQFPVNEQTDTVTETTEAVDSSGDLTKADMYVPERKIFARNF